jgi:hypothetical protein
MDSLARVIAKVFLKGTRSKILITLNGLPVMHFVQYNLIENLFQSQGNLRTSVAKAFEQRIDFLSMGFQSQGIPFKWIPFEGIPFEGVPFEWIPFEAIHFEGIPFEGIPFEGVFHLNSLYSDSL